MKTYTITVNGNVYDVTVEENGREETPKVSSARRPAPAARKAAPSGKTTGTGSIKVEAGAAGKVLKIDAQVGTQVKAGTAVVTIESMKMEIPMVAPKDGTVASIDVAVGDSCEAGQVLATLN